MADENITKDKEKNASAQSPEQSSSDGHGAAPSAGSTFLNQKDAEPTGEFYHQTPEEEKSRKKRSLAIGAGLLAFVLLIYLITMLKLSGNA